MKFNFFTFLIALSTIITTVGCGDNPGQNDPCQIDFDQKAMLENMATNIILPSYATFAEHINTLTTQHAAFTAAPDQQTLTNFRNAFTDAYKSWSRVALYEFGPAEAVLLRSNLNNFPLDIDATLANIESGNYNLDNPDSYDKGFPALDYLLYGSADSDAAIIAKLQETNTSQYLADILADIKMRTTQTVNEWTTGDYKSTFVNNTGVQAGSAVSLIVNNLNHYYELIKRDKIGIPSGVLTLGFTHPEKTEAHHSGISFQLIDHAIDACHELYEGKGNLGLDDYLNAADAQKDGQPLAQEITKRFEDAAASVATHLDTRLSTLVEDDQDEATMIYNTIVKQLITLKTDMPFALCVSITYVDNPSDSD